MAGLVPAIHGSSIVLFRTVGVDGRVKPGHDEVE
jgi:hypothetical protein